MCPSGRGLIPNGDSLYGVPTADSYKGKTKLLLYNLKKLNLQHKILYVATPLHALYLFADADECTLFGQEVCKGGFCLDTVGSYECYCKTGQDYDPAKLECRGQDDKQQTEKLCVFVCVCMCV